MANILQDFFTSKAKATSTITDLRIYPIKSCRGISVKSTILTKCGLDLDRRWMFVSNTSSKDDDKTPKKFVTIREISELTLIQTAFACSNPAEIVNPNAEHLNTSSKDISRSRKESENLQLVISISGTGKYVCIPARPSQEWLSKNTTLETVEIWGTETDGYVYSSAINSMFSEFLQRDVALVYKGPTPRVLRGNGAPEVLGREQTTNFPDVLPLLIANEDSMRELNERLRAKGHAEIGIERFRPNVVVKGGVEAGMLAWGEDEWKTVRIVPSASKTHQYHQSQDSGNDNSWFSFASGLRQLDLKGEQQKKGLVIDVAARCARCQVPNVEPDTAVKDKKEPWDTLVSYRRVDEGIKWKPCFGMLSVPRDEGVVRVGMRFEVVETTKDHLYIKGF